MGAGIPTAVGKTRAVYAGDIPASGVDPDDAALCFRDSLDRAKAAGN